MLSEGADSTVSGVPNETIHTHPLTLRHCCLERTVNCGSCEIQIGIISWNQRGPGVRVLLVEDDPKLSRILRDALEKRAYKVTVANCGSEGLSLGREFEFEMVILDAMLPKLDGFAVAKGLRSSNISVPILMLTSRDATADIVRGLDSGVDDYLTKPFAFDELFARMRALARRRAVAPAVQYEVLDLELDPRTHLASRSGRSISLTRTEYLLLEFMMRNANTVLRRDSIINAVWGYDTTVENNTLDAFMKQLRFKVDHGYEQKLLHTVRGFGYKLSAGDY